MKFLSRPVVLSSLVLITTNVQANEPLAELNKLNVVTDSAIKAGLTREAVAEFGMLANHFLNAKKRCNLNEKQADKALVFVGQLSNEVKSRTKLDHSGFTKMSHDIFLAYEPIATSAFNKSGAEICKTIIEELRKR